MKTSQRIRRLERKARPVDNIVVWWACDGKPCPPHEPEDMVFKVVYDTEGKTDEQHQDAVG